MIVVDDSPEVDHEIFETDEFDGEEWVLIAEDAPLDEHKRDELVERFQLSHGAGTRPAARGRRSTTMTRTTRTTTTSSTASKTWSSTRSERSARALR